MYGVCRYYTGAGAKELFDLLESRKSDVEGVIRAVGGVQSYNLIKLADGSGLSVTICSDKAACEATNAAAASWIRDNASGMSAPAPMVSEGEVIASL